MLLGTDARLGADAGGGRARGHDHPRAPRRRRVRDHADLDPARPQGHDPGPRTARRRRDGQDQLRLRARRRQADRRDGEGALRPVETSRFKINHVVQVDFLGFRRMVDYLGCTYVDVDRDYFNDSARPSAATPSSTSTRATRSSAGRTRWPTCATATRTTTSCARRASRTSCARCCASPASRSGCRSSKRKEITKIAGRYARVDQALTQKAPLLTLLKLGLNVAGKTVQQVPFGNGKVAYEGRVPDGAAKRASPRPVEAFLDPAEAPQEDDADTVRAGAAQGAREVAGRGARRARRRRGRRQDTGHRAQPPHALPVLLPQARDGRLRAGRAAVHGQRQAGVPHGRAARRARRASTTASRA